MRKVRIRLANIKVDDVLIGARVQFVHTHVKRSRKAKQNKHDTVGVTFGTLDRDGYEMNVHRGNGVSYRQE